MSNKSDLYIETKREGTYIITDDENPVPIHELVAIAEYGIESVTNNDIYHLNMTSWDNRPENICLVENADDEEFIKRGYWKMVNGEPQLHLYQGEIHDLAMEK